jgi:hypothetical protein
MASSKTQKPLGNSPSHSIEIQERDQSNNLVATYITTTAASGGQGKSARVDVDVYFHYSPFPFEEEEEENP